MATVVCKKTIRSAKGLLIAEGGAVGEAVKGRSPHEKANVGRVLVQWSGRKRGYWCRPELLEFRSAVDKEEYVARPHGGRRAVGGSALPVWSISTSFHFGENLRRFRLARGLSQQQLSQQMGVRQSTISTRERCPDPPGCDFLRTAARVLQLPAVVFLFPPEAEVSPGKVLLFLKQVYGGKTSGSDRAIEERTCENGSSLQPGV